MWDDKARATLAKTFLDALKDNVIPWRKCWSAVPVSFSTGKPYRGINNLTLSFVSGMKGYRDTRWLTFKQAQNNGWRVRKGERAIRVEYWHYYDKVTRKNIEWSEVRRIQREEPERMKDICLAACTYNVFNAEQIDGMPLQQASAVFCDTAALMAQRDAFLQNLGVGLQEGGDQAFYSPQFDIITMPFAQHFASDYGYLCTLLHEAGHATGHSSRLDRQISNTFDSADYAKEELRAEIASAFTAQALQLPYREADLADGLKNHTAYIQDWIAILKNDPNELFAAIKDAEKIADYLIDQGQLRELTQANRQAQPVGRIDFLASTGQVGESVEYTDAGAFVSAVKEENYYGVPMVIAVYQNSVGSHIPTSFLQTLDPPPAGFHFEPCPDRVTVPERPEVEPELSDDYEMEL